MTLGDRTISEVQALLTGATQNPRRAMIATMLLVDIASYQDGARAQIERIAKNLKVSNEDTTRREEAIGQALMDVHFYFICWHAIHERLDLLKSLSGMKALGTVLRTNREHLEHYSRGRDHLEHFADRLRGKKNKKGDQLAQPNHLGDLDALGTFYFGGDSYDVTPRSLSLLESIVSAVIRALLDEAQGLADLNAHAPAPN